jgi:hypothetical protein
LQHFYACARLQLQKKVLQPGAQKSLVAYAKFNVI